MKGFKSQVRHDNHHGASSLMAGRVFLLSDVSTLSVVLTFTILYAEYYLFT
jgi:hypothetical protein